MTDKQSNQIRELRMKGVGYRSIASVVGLSRDIVRNFCKQKGLDGYASAMTKNVKKQMQRGNACYYCDKTITQPSTGRPRKFCSDTCRRDWWKSHPEGMTKRDTAVYILKCAKCGREFESYGNSKRKYCNHNCYIKDRFYMEEIKDEV